MEMVIHNTICDDVNITIFLVFKKQTQKQLFVVRCSEYGLFVVATVVYMVETVGFEISQRSGHRKMIAGRDEIEVNGVGGGSDPLGWRDWEKNGIIVKSCVIMVLD